MKGQPVKIHHVMATDAARAAATGDCCTHGEVTCTQKYITSPQTMSFYIQLLGSLSVGCGGSPPYTSYVGNRERSPGREHPK